MMHVRQNNISTYSSGYGFSLFLRTALSNLTNLPNSSAAVFGGAVDFKYCRAAAAVESANGVEDDDETRTYPLPSSISDAAKRP